MAPTSTTQTAGFWSRASHMVGKHSTIWGIASLDTFTVVFVLLDWVFMAKKNKHKTQYTSKVSTYFYVHATPTTHACRYATVCVDFFFFFSKWEMNQKKTISTHPMNSCWTSKYAILKKKCFWWKIITSLQNDVIAKNSTFLRLPCQSETNPKLYFLIKKLIQIRFMWCLEYPSTDLKCITLLQCAPLGTGLLILKYDLAYT